MNSRLDCVSTDIRVDARRGGVADAVTAQRGLTARDDYLIRLLAHHRVLSTEQITRALFPNLNVARKRLVVLARRGILARFRICVRPGSQPWRYTLGPLGAMIHAAATGTALPAAAKTDDTILKLARNPRLDHLLGVNDFFIALLEYARHDADCALAEWWNERDTTEATARMARPDGYGLWRHGTHQVEFFLEYDTGTETLDRLTTKLDGYRDLAAGGIARPVLFVFTSTTRLHHFHRTLTDTSARARLTVASTATADYAHTSPAAPIWLLPGATTRRRLIDLTTTATTTPAA